MRGFGYHASAWRHPGASPIADLAHYTSIARTAERGLFDMVFLADFLAVRTADTPAGILGRAPAGDLEPLTLLSAIAALTSDIGLAATASTTFQEPYNIARMFASLDQLSGGRAAWNMVTSFQDDEARNYSGQNLPEKSRRYARAREGIDVITRLWDSWDEGAFLRDKASGRYFDPAKLHLTDFEGEFFRVRGPLTVPRSPQGRPIIIQAGASAEGQELAAATADVVYAAHSDIADARVFYRSVKERMAKYGRHPDSLKVMPGLLTVIGATEAEAQAKYQAMQEILDPVVGLGFLLGSFGDLSGHDLDGPVPELRTDKVVMSRGDVMLKHARRHNLTIRQLFQSAAIGNAHHVVVGTARKVADVMEEWVAEGAADGFNFLPAVSPTSLEEFVDHVVPELQRRGLFRTEYEGTTLRAKLGLPEPAPTREPAAG